MLPTVNGKHLYDCTFEEFKEILGNSDFHENEYLDFKQSFSILDYSKQERHNAISEFRSDVCSFANANGGYLVYGVKEDGTGVPSELAGISIDNADKFELNIKTWLGPINPRVPNYSIKFFDLGDGKYVVILFVKHDSFAPYVHLENEKDYKIYKRVGNGKIAMSYSEMKNMFTQSIMLEKEIERFRNERIDYYRSQSESADDKYSKFMLLHIIPETFLDSTYNQPLFVLGRKDNRFYPIFKSFECQERFAPTVDGLRYVNYLDESEGILYNNGIAELFFSLQKHLHFSKDQANGFFPWLWAWKMILSAITEYLRRMPPLYNTEKIYVGFTLCGCKDVRTDDNMVFDPSGSIDRDKLVMRTVVIESTEDVDVVNQCLKQFYLDYLLALGKRSRDDLDGVIKDLYEKKN